MNKAIVKQFIICIFSGLIIYLGLMSATALVLLKLPVQQSTYTPIAFAIAVLCCAVTSFVATRITGQRGIVTGGITAVVFNIFLAVLLLIASKGSLSMKFFILIAVNIAVGIISGIYAANLRRKR